ncbi:mucin-17 isoform X1 [Ceratitis capitata]|uniref:mucin-17 isoform X1 n=1 Tax=Ceratitis capitata TaxID=7213 RepID=UPI00061889D4|nr:mucin-17 isoform X1 [Ceratitis capitata]XP_012160714.1 mucin-17 isoform X1 [Ceratitis capitata]XP_012160715.1 mucin-17 isoform X1 [Ceratitis capitata]XP_012160716.1 mucin-17 isoform X1 [Ceratitis capitata]
MLSSTRRISQQESTRLWILTVCVVATLSGCFVTPALGAPAKLDAIAPPPQSPFPLETQPTQFSEAIAAALKSDIGVRNDGGKSHPSAVDSYGNPIETLKPIDTPDGRKVISAQGLQFEIPNYASGITEIKQPADDLLPPFIDPIAVAVPTDSIDGENSVPETAATALTTTTVDVENAQLVELKPSQSNLFSLSSQSSNLPSYILDLNDPDIDGPVEYMPAEDGSSLKVIAWDLLPPFQEEPKLITADSSVTPITHNTKVSLTSGHSVSAQGPSHGVSSEGSDAVVPQNNLPPGSGIQVTSSTIASTTRTTTPRTTRATTPHTTRPTTTRPTTTRPTTTRPRTTTTRRATTTTRLPITTTTRRAPTTKKTTSTTTTTPIPTQLSSKDFYQLEHGDSYTLPSWLADIDDPELDAAVTYIVPENIHEYNDTISRDILPPLEPYTDLNNIDLPAPEGLHTTTTTTNRPRTTAATSTTSEVYTSTSRSSTISTPRPHWVRAYPTTTPTTTTTSTQKPKSFNDRISSNHIALSHDSNSASSFISPNSKASTSFLGTTSTTTTTTESPRLTTAEPHHHIVNNRFNKNSPTITVDHTASNKIKDNKAIPTATFSNANPFLPAHNSGARPFATKSTDKFTGTSSTTTTTTTTTTAATPVEENPFDSATLPPWLADFDYPDLGPGVAFIYEAEDSNSDVSNDLLPPSQLTAEAADTTKPVFISSSPSSFNSFQISPSSTNRHETTFASASTSPTRTFTFNNFPSKVTTTVKPLSIQNTFAQVPNSNNNNYNQEAVTSPPVLFIPPNAEAESNIDTAAVNDISKSQLQPAATAGQTFSKKPSSSSFNKNFAAPFEPTTVPGSADSDQDFGSSTKTTFTKSDEGKVISNNIFGNNGGITAATKQFGLSTASSTTGQASLQKELQHSTFSGSLSTFNKAVTPGGFSSFTSTQQTNFNSAGSVKYTGGFGGAPGVLGSGKFGSAVNTDGSIRTATNLTFGQAPTAAPKQTTSPSFVSRIGIPATGVTATALGTGVNKYQGTFGGPPGVLTPFDSVKSG